MNDVDAAKARLDRMLSTSRAVYPVTEIVLRDWPIISAELDRLREENERYRRGARITEQERVHNLSQQKERWSHLDDFEDCETCVAALREKED